MPTIATVLGVKIAIYADDHNPPHCHAIFAEHAAQIRIADASVMAGSLPRARLRVVLKWVVENQGLLAAEWLKFNGDN